MQITFILPSEIFQRFTGTRELFEEISLSQEIIRKLPYKVCHCPRISDFFSKMSWLAPSFNQTFSSSSLNSFSAGCFLMSGKSLRVVEEWINQEILLGRHSTSPSGIAFLLILFNSNHSDEIILNPSILELLKFWCKAGVCRRSHKFQARWQTTTNLRRSESTDEIFPLVSHTF